MQGAGGTLLHTIGKETEYNLVFLLQKENVLLGETESVLKETRLSADYK